MRSSQMIGLHEVWDLLKPEDQQENGNRYFYYFGAGLSSGSVPLAEEMARACLEKLGEQGIYQWGKDQSERFRELLETAYPEKEQRSGYLESLCQKGPNRANYLAARLLIFGKPCSLAVTGNFDHHLISALIGYGERPIVEGDERFFHYSDPDSGVRLVKTVGSVREFRLDRIRSGQSIGEDLPNVAPEDEERLIKLMHSRSPLVIGFSGREENPFMRALWRVIRDDALPRPLFWFLHREDEYYCLPRWLREHHNVVFVADRKQRPKAEIPFKGAYMNRYLDLSLETLRGESAKDNHLTACEVLGYLVDRTSAPFPPVLSDPGGFVAAQRYRLVRNYPGAEHILWNEKLTVENTGEMVQGPLGEAQRHLAYERHPQALAALGEINIEELNEESRKRFLDLLVYVLDQEAAEPTAERSAMLQRGLEMSLQQENRGTEEYPVYLAEKLVYMQYCLGEGEQGLRILRTVLEDPQVRESYQNEEKDRLQFFGTVLAVTTGEYERAWSMLNPQHYQIEASRKQIPLYRSWIAMHVGNYEKAAEILENEDPGTFYTDVLLAMIDFNRQKYEGLERALDQLSQRAEREQNNPVLGCLLQYLRAETVESRNMDPHPVKAWNRVLNRYEGACSRPIRMMRALSYYKKAQALRKAGSLIESTKVAVQMREDYGEDREIAIQILCAQAQLDAIKVKKELNWQEEALQECDRFLDEFGSIGDLEMKELSARVLFLKGIMLRSLDRREDAIVALGILADFRHQSSNIPILKYVGRAMKEMGTLLRDLNRNQEALQVYREIVETNRDLEEPELVELLSDAYRKATGLLIDGGSWEEAVQLAEEGILRVRGNDAVEIKRNVASLYLDGVRALKELHRPDQAVELIDRFLKDLGQEQDQILKIRLSRAMAEKGRSLEALSRSQESLQTYEDFVKLYGDMHYEEINGDVLDVLYRRGNLFHQVGQILLAQQSMQKLVDKATALDDQRHWPQLADGWLQKIAMHREEEQFAEQLATLNQMIDFFEERMEKMGYLALVKARLERAMNHRISGREADAVAELVYLRMLGMSEATQETAPLYAQGARVEAQIYLKLHRYQELEQVMEETAGALWVYDGNEMDEDLLSILQYYQQGLLEQEEHRNIVQNSGRIIERFRENTGSGFSGAVAQAILEKMESLYVLRDHGALALHYQQGQSFFEGKKEPVLQEVRMKFMHLMIDDLREIGAYQESMEICREIIENPTMPGVSGLRDARMLAQYKLGRTLGGLGNGHKALELFEIMEKEYRSAETETQRLLYYKSLLEQAVLLVDGPVEGFLRRRNLKKVLRLLDRVIEALAGDEDEESMKCRLKGMHQKGKVLSQLNRKDEARQIYREALNAYGDRPEAGLDSLVFMCRKELDKL